MGKPKKGRRSDRQRYSRRDGQFDLDNDEDIALLSKPFDASIKGVIDLMKAFENGTREVQYLLQYECGLLFECRVCRSIFRSIVNFITHKRVYCRAKGPSDSSQTGQSFDEFMKDVQSLVILQEPAVCEPSTSPTTVPTNNDAADNNATVTINEEKPSPPRLSKRKAFPRKNLIEVLDRLCQKESSDMERPMVMTSRDRACVTSVSGSKLQTPILCLEKIEHTDVAMHQTVTLGPDGKILNDKHDIKFRGDVIDMDESLDTKCDSNSQPEVKCIERLCKPCNIKFSTRKTFRQHMKSKHNSNRSWYLCPDCTSIFSQIYSVHRHLRRFHRKSEAQMVKLHGKIKHLPENQLPAAYAASVSNKRPLSKSTLRETKRLVVSHKAEVLDNEFYDLFLTEKNTCSGCTRKFDRIASFNTHMQTCPRRHSVLNSTKSQSETQSSMLRTLVRNSGDSFLTRTTNISETVDTKTLSSVSTPQFFVSHPEVTEDNSTSDIISTCSDIQGQSIVLNHRTRRESEMRLEPPVKRIEIQLRMDYNKVGASQSQVIASCSDLLDPLSIVNVRKSPDTVAINERINPEENEPTTSTNATQVILLSSTEEDSVTDSTSSIKNKLLKKSLTEESTQEAALNSLGIPSAASVLSTSSIVQDALTDEYLVPTTVEETMLKQSSNEDEIMPQCDTKPTSGEVLDNSTQNFQKCIVVENHLDAIQASTIEVDVCSLKADHDLEMSAVIYNRPKVITQLVHNRKITKNKILRYRCGECWHHFSSLNGGQNHIEKCHTTGKLWRNNARSGILSNSWTCVANNSKRSSSVDTSKLDSEINGDIGCETDPLLSLGEPLESDSFQGPNHPTKCSVNIASAAGISTTRHVSKITRAFPSKESKPLVNEKETLNINEDSSSIIGLRPKRHRMNAQINATAVNDGKVVQTTHRLTFDDQIPINMRTARKAYKEGKQWADKEKTDVHSDGKRAKVECLSTQPLDVSTENDQVPANEPPTKQVHIPMSTSTSCEQVEPEAKASKAVLEPIKSQTQDNTNIYKNVSKSVIEVIFGSDLSSSMFSSDHFATEEEVTIIEDQINGTFSLDISCTPEKNKDNVNIIQNETHGSSTTRRRMSFSLDSEQMSSPDSGQGSSDMVPEVCHAANEVSNNPPICNTSKTIVEKELTSKAVLDGLEKIQIQNACPIILLEKLVDHNSVITTEMMLMKTNATSSSCCVSNSSAKQNSISSLKAIPPTEESKLDLNKISTPGYNISTRKSMRVFDTKPLRRTTSIDADVHCKR